MSGVDTNLPGMPNLFELDSASDLGRRKKQE